MSAEPNGESPPVIPPDFSRIFAEVGGPPIIWNNGFLSFAHTVDGGQHMGVPATPAGTPARSDTVERREGDIAAEQTLAAMSGFAEPHWFAEALTKLSGRVVFLAGARGSGRRTAALNLLRRKTDSFALRAVDSDVELATWTVGSTGARGYLIDGLLETRTLALGSIALEGLRGQLDRAEAFLVVVIEPTPEAVAHLRDALHIEPVRAEPPSPSAVLDAKLKTLFPDEGRRRSALAALPAGFLDQTLQRRPGPSQVVEIASEIVRVANGEAPAEDIG
ncbi:hypothetical protein GCM10020000_11410 [Streptomyces olivoverticillatus]